MPAISPLAMRQHLQAGQDRAEDGPQFAVEPEGEPDGGRDDHRDDESLGSTSDAVEGRLPQDLLLGLVGQRIPYLARPGNHVVRLQLQVEDDLPDDDDDADGDQRRQCAREQGLDTGSLSTTGLQGIEARFKLAEIGFADLLVNRYVRHGG
ncbi:MAG: hypothetical protein NTX29_01560 [Actinobacteria bacterium]|nr:hypothetical protein [Actinomycetota bacterium]